MDLFNDDSDDDSAEEELLRIVMVVRRVLKKARLRIWSEKKEETKAFGEIEFAEYECDVVLYGREERVRRGGLLVVSEAMHSVEWQEIERCAKWMIYQKRYLVSRNPNENESIAAVVATAEETAVRILREYGLVILPNFFLDVKPLEKIAARALIRFDEIADSALRNYGIDIRESGQGANFREISNREHFRFDLKLSFDLDLEKISKICREAATPPASTPHIDGNFGRFNFNDNGPRSPRPPLPIGSAGCVLTLPGAADQALHADTPHLFDHLSLPGHYFNLFLFAPQTVQDPQAGLTAFVLRSHRLDLCSDFLSASPSRMALATTRTQETRSMTTSPLEKKQNILNPADTEKKTVHSPSSLPPPEQQQQEQQLQQKPSPAILPTVIRPRLQPGDALIFDARILHYGLANKSKTEPRPLLYVNLHEAWFREPKVWSDAVSVFDPSKLE